MKSSFNHLLISLILVLSFATCRNKKEKTQRKYIGGYYVEAIFKNDTVIDGPAKFFTRNGGLVSFKNYVNGVENGFAIDYYKNGEKSDSMNFVNGLKNGFQYYYDSIDNNYSIGYTYYGIRMGPEIFYINNKPVKYYFTDFRKEGLINCKYDSAGSLVKLSDFRMGSGIAEVLSGGDKMLELYFLLPNPPNVEVDYNLGISNDNAKQNKNLFPINKDRVVLDTTMPYPEKGWYYYLSAHIKNKNASVNKVYMEEVNQDGPPPDKKK